MDAVTKAMQELEWISKRAYQRGLTSGSGGNISARVEGMDRVVIKSSGVSFADTKEENIILVDLYGNVVEGSLKPSKEVKFHCGIYRVRPEVGAVVHTHSPAATAFSVVGKEIPMVTVSAAKGVVRTPVVAYAPPGSEELARLVMNLFEGQTLKTALLQNHGVVAVGKDLLEALYLAEVVEDTAKIAIYAQGLGTPLQFE
ncbi:MAG: class II aldolase/adducin family protein [candidate division NC10 bacterium]|nr:class II aldolase/adducin family protein [candidate division NC10 bacterium]